MYRNEFVPIYLRIRKASPICTQRANPARMQPIKAAGRRALDRRLIGLDEQIGDPPFRGWVRTLRDALGMSTLELGLRMGISSRRVLQLEQGESGGAVRLSTLERAAAALHCRLFYVLVPTQSLNDIVRVRAREVATAEHASRAGPGRLDGEPVDDEILPDLLEARTYELIDTPALWRSKPRPIRAPRDQGN
jgi:predicted DNA-binding mobile mystery protein A